MPRRPLPSGQSGRSTPFTPARDPIEQLKQLGALHEQGILTDEEFADGQDPGLIVEQAGAAGAHVGRGPRTDVELAVDGVRVCLTVFAETCRWRPIHVPIWRTLYRERQLRQLSEDTADRVRAARPRPRRLE
jgi:hypothetical protein